MYIHYTVYAHVCKIKIGYFIAVIYRAGVGKMGSRRGGVI